MKKIKLNYNGGQLTFEYGAFRSIRLTDIQARPDGNSPLNFSQEFLDNITDYDIENGIRSGIIFHKMFSLTKGKVNDIISLLKKEVCFLNCISFGKLKKDMSKTTYDILHDYYLNVFIPNYEAKKIKEFNFLTLMPSFRRSSSDGFIDTILYIEIDNVQYDPVIMFDDNRCITYYEYADKDNDYDFISNGLVPHRDSDILESINQHKLFEIIHNRRSIKKN